MNHMMLRVLAAILLLTSQAQAALTYRTDGAWGTGKGTPLTWAEGDTNTWELGQFHALSVVDVRRYHTSFGGLNATWATALSAALAAATDGQTVLFDGPYTASPSAQIVISTRVRLELRRGATISADSMPEIGATHYRDAPLKITADRTVLDGGAIVSTSALLGGQLLYVYADDVEITGVRFDANNQVLRAAVGYQCNGIGISDVVGGKGHRTYIHGNTFNSCAYAVSVYAMTGTVVQANTFTECDYAFNSGGTPAGDATGSVFQGNRVLDWYLAGVKARGIGPVTVRDNWFSGPKSTVTTASPCLKTEDSRGAFVADGNYIDIQLHGNGTAYKGVAVDLGATGTGLVSRITANEIIDCPGTNVNVGAGHGAYIAGNHIHTTGTVDAGVYLYASTKEAIVRDNVIDVNGYCVRASGATLGRIRGNVLKPGTGLYAVQLDSSSSDMEISGNDITSGATGKVNPSSVTDLRMWNNKGLNPVGQTIVSATTSPQTVTCGTSPATLYIYGGTVSNVTRGGTTVCSASPCAVPVEPNGTVVVTYSSNPTMKWDIQ